MIGPFSGHHAPETGSRLGHFGVTALIGEGKGTGLVITMSHMRKASLGILIAGCLVVAGSRSVRGAADGALLDILQAELERNLDALVQEPMPPYFLSYAVNDRQLTTISASFGSLVASSENRTRMLDVDVRVGNYAQDSTHQLRGDRAVLRSTFTRMPLDTDERAVRAVLWRTTDREFKQAAARLTRVTTNVAARVEEERAADFSREEPQAHEAPLATYSLDTDEWEERVRRISAPFAENPLIFNADVSLAVQAENRYFVSSEGARLLTGQTSSRIFIQAMTRADDGMDLPLFTSYFARTPDGLPTEDQLVAAVRQMMRLLDELREAPLVDPSSGPAILSGRAAGVFFHEIFGHRIEGHRQKNADDAQTFANRVGEQILPPFLDVVFDPTLAALGTIELNGHYLYDDEGVKGRPVTVVEDGVLETFLMSRSPLPNLAQSNGHGRAQFGFSPVSRQSNLLVNASETMPYDRLVERLKEEARRQGKPFGLLFDNIEGGFTFTSRNAPNAFNVLPNVVYRIYTDDRPPELVRGVDLVGTPLTAFGKIMAAGDELATFNGMCGAESGSVPVSASSPALLISEVEVQKKATSQEVLPILPAPDGTGRT